MKNLLIHILSIIFQGIETLLCRLRIKRPKVIVFMDGGICSQMLMYIQGRYYDEKGLDVYYDTLWYQTYGKDADGLMPRFLEFSEMWPGLEFKSVSKSQRKWYLLFFKAQRTNGDELPKPESLTRSIYLDGWWNLPNEDNSRMFPQYFNINSSATPINCKDRSFENVVGVHVRRGDLAKGDNPYYGGVTDGYFLRAIEFCNEKFHPQKYLFFSDGPDWVEQNICNYITQPYEIMRGNKAWEDLWLLAHCPIIVASQGSFGKVAARLNSDAVLIQCDNERANHARKNTYLMK